MAHVLGGPHCALFAYLDPADRRLDWGVNATGGPGRGRPGLFRRAQLGPVRVGLWAPPP